MSEQDLNNEIPYEKIPTNDMGESSTGGLVGQSSIKDVIDSAAGINPTRFWIVVMVALIIGLASAIIFGGGYLIDQGKKKDDEITMLRKEIKDCPEKTIDDLKKQREAIDDIRNGVLYNSQRIQEIKSEKLEDVEDSKTINKKLTELTTP